ncbi:MULTISPECIES: hypothetical protein [unclassified Frankia]
MAAWLAVPEAGRTELRDPGLLKLAFADLGRPGDVSRLARAQAAAHRAHLEVYRSLTALPAGALAWSLRRALDLGLGYEELAVEFWERLAAEPGGAARRSADGAVPAPGPQVVPDDVVAEGGGIG